MIKRTLFIAALAASIAFNAYAYENGDFQIWNTGFEELKIVKDLKLVLEEEFRWGNNASELYYQHYDAGLFYDINKHLNVGGGYRQIYELYKDKFKPDYSPYMVATLFWEIAGFDFENRNRMEFNNFDHKIDFWRWRNKGTIKLPWKFTRLEIQPYLSDEIFIVFGEVKGALNQNRFSSGIMMNLAKNIKADIHYMLLSVKGKVKWTDANVLGFKLKIAF